MTLTSFGERKSDKRDDAVYPSAALVYLRKALYRVAEAKRLND